MKKITLLLSIFSFIFCFGQDKTYTMAMDSLLSQVDKSPMATGILYDRVFSHSDLNTSTSPPVTYEYFMQIWNELHTSSLSPEFLSADRLQEQIDLKKEENKVILGILNLKMDYLDYGTESNPNLTFSNGYFHNVPGKNPFLRKTVKLAFPLTEGIKSAAPTFVISPSFIAQDNHSSPVSSMQIDFGDGILRTYNILGNFIAQEQPVQYATPGIKTVTMQLSYADNTTQSFQFDINIDFNPNISKAAGTYNEFEDFTGVAGITQTIPFQGYNEPSASYGKLEYRTYYNRVSNLGYDPTDHSFTVQPKLRKPVIILDGFDPGDGRKLDEINDLMSYDPDGIPQTDNNKSLVEDLQNQGYDVTLVNFPRGADFIERNAMALVALLQ